MLFLIASKLHGTATTKNNHTLEELDRFKRNLKLRKLAGQEMKKRYRACDIKATIKSNNNPTASAKL